VDPVTHTLIGVGMANAFFRRRVGPESVIILAIASNLPDVDAVVHLTGDPTAILMRRTFGHSIFMFPLWSMGLAFILRRLYPHLSLRILFGLSLLGCVVHIFFDLVNSFGVVLLWPFSNWRPELGIIFIIDLFLTGFLAAPLLLSIPRQMRPHLVWLSRISVACVTAYVLFCGINRVISTRLLAAETRNFGIHSNFSYVFPEPLGPHRWKGVSREQDIYHLYLIHSLAMKIEKVSDIKTQADDPQVEHVRATALAHRLEWFFKAPVWSIKNEPDNKTVQVNVYDLRFQTILINRKPPFFFRFALDKDGKINLLH
jgi:inner membrane protein